MHSDDVFGQRCRASPSSTCPAAAAADEEVAWRRRHCMRLSVYTVKIAAATNHSGFAIQSLDESNDYDYINFGAVGLYREPKWDLSNATYRYLNVISTSERELLERHHTREVAGTYFWLTNCCHHSTERELRRMGYDTTGARGVTWFDLARVKDNSQPPSV